MLMVPEKKRERLCFATPRIGDGNYSDSDR